MADPTLPNPNSTISTCSSSSATIPSTNSSVLEQYTNPYYLHHSDPTNVVLVSNLLTETNYTSWSQAMVIGLTVKNKFCFVDGSLPRPTGELLKSWNICNSIVTLWILNSLSKEISARVNFSDSAHEIWIDLQERYRRKNRPRVFQLRREFFCKNKILWLPTLQSWKK